MVIINLVARAFSLTRKNALGTRLGDHDSCFHNDVPNYVRSIKHERDIIVNAIARIHCW